MNIHLHFRLRTQIWSTLQPYPTLSWRRRNTWWILGWWRCCFHRQWKVHRHRDSMWQYKRTRGTSSTPRSNGRQCDEWMLSVEECPFSTEAKLYGSKLLWRFCTTPHQKVNWLLCDKLNWFQDACSNTVIGITISEGGCGSTRTSSKHRFS